MVTLFLFPWLWEGAAETERQVQSEGGDVFFLELWILHIQIVLVVMLIAVDLYLLFHISQRHSSGSKLVL